MQIDELDEVLFFRLQALHLEQEHGTLVIVERYSISYVDSFRRQLLCVESRVGKARNTTTTSGRSEIDQTTGKKTANGLSHVPHETSVRPKASQYLES